MEIGFKLDLDVAESASQGGRIGTGVYAVTIEKNFLYKSEKGNNLIDLELKSENGEVGFINRLCIDEKWESGAENFDYPRWQELAAACQMQSLTQYPSKRKMSGEDVDAISIKELTQKKIKVALYISHDAYQNKATETLKLQGTFLPTGQSITEARAKKPAERINKLAERLEPFYTKEWKAWKAQGGSANSAIDDVSVKDIAVPNISAEEEDDLFG